MRLPKSMRRLASASVALGLLAVLLPQSASAATDFSKVKEESSLRQTVVITDKGFSPAELTLSVSSNPFYGEITFRNDGSTTHSAKLLPGNGSSTNYTNINKYGNGQTKGTQNGPLDTGGIDPGQEVKVGFSYAGDYIYTSYPDCIAGDRQAGNPFNCSPAIVHAVSYAGPTGGAPLLSSTLDGDTLEVAGVRTPHFDTNSSIAKPYPSNANVQVSITDDKGYLPSRIYISPGTTVTWTNNGNTVHSVLPRGGFKSAPDNYHYIDSGGLAPGQSYSYVFNYTAPARCDGGKAAGTSCTGFTYLNVFGVQSNQENDLILPKDSGFPNAGRTTASTMIGKIYQVVKCDDSDGIGYCGNPTN